MNRPTRWILALLASSSLTAAPEQGPVPNIAGETVAEVAAPGGPKQPDWQSVYQNIRADLF